MAQRRFLTETQNPLEGTHLTPKTLAIVDTGSFQSFNEEYENLISLLSERLMVENDQDYFAAITRSRNVATAFMGGANDAGTRTPSIVDIGSFLTNFKENCAPSELSDIGTALDTALQAYNTQFTARGYGQGTKPTTGMGIWFPSRKQYSEVRVEPVSLYHECMFLCNLFSYPAFYPSSQTDFWCTDFFI